MRAYKFLLAPLMFAGAAFPPSALAQQAESDDIIITAQRREQALQDVPLAVSALSADMLDQSGIDDVTEIGARVPSFFIGQQGPSSPDLTIRGIGSSDRDAGSDRSVIVFVDDVYAGRAGGIPPDLFDLERVEVLRGPQGTLYGKNAVGGAVNFITRRPGRTFDARADVTVGSDELFAVRAAVGGPLSETLSGRIAVSARSEGPLYTNLLFNRETDDYALAAGRGQLLWEPNNALSVLFSADISHDEIDGITTHITPVTPALLANGYTPNPDPFTGYQNALGFLDRDIAGFSLRADWDTSFGTLTSITAHRRLDMAETRDLVGNPIRPGPLGFESTQIVTEVSENFSQELRLASPNNNAALTWIVGLFYQTEDVHRIEERKRQLNAAVSWPVFDQDARTTSYAVFGQLTWAINERLNLTLGGRYTQDERDFSLAVSNPYGFASLSPATAVFSQAASDEWDAFTPKLTLDYDFTENLMGYVTVSRGYKSGGYQGLAANAAAAQTSFNPEFVTNYEIGFKSELFDRRLTLNTAAYYMDFTDLQFRQRILTIPGDQASAIVIVANAGAAEIMGLELESVFRATDWLTLSLTHSYLETEIVEFNATPGVADVTGRDLARSPRHSTAFAADLSWPVGDNFIFGVRGEYRAVSSFWFEPSGDRALYEPGYGLVDARLSLAPNDGRWRIELWGSNLTDETYRTFAQAIGFATAGVSAATTRTGDPATWGLTYRWRY